MSLNRSEQMILDYVQTHPDERHHWEAKVRSAAKASATDAEAASSLDAELWYYFKERAEVVEPFKSAVARDGLRRTSMKNLAEYWLRIWTPPRQKKKKQGELFGESIS